MRNGRRSESRGLLRELFAPRQVYLRTGAASQFVTVSRGLQVAVAAGFVVLALWLGLASYAAIAKHLETVQQSRELARLEGVAQSLRTTVEGAQVDQAASEAAAGADLADELAAVKAERARALLLAKVSADEAAELRREVALANQRVDELKRALVKSSSPPAGERKAEATDGAGSAADKVAEAAPQPR